MYGLFYWMVNLGSFTATLIVPELLARRGARAAFALPAFLMVAALALFWAGRRRYVNVAPTGPNPSSFVRVTAHALRRRAAGARGGHWLDAARDRFPPEAVEGAKAVFRISGVFAAITGFWALFDQHGSSWVLQAAQMDLAVGRWALKASQLSAVNPILVLVLIPLFSAWLYPWLERRGLRVTPLRKMGAGMFLATLSFAASAVLQELIDAGGRPHALWQVVPYLFLTASEVLVSVTALEFAYTQAPASMKSAIMSLWYVTIAAGSLLTAWVASLNRFHGAGYYFFFAALMLAAALAFHAVARRYRPVEYQPHQPAGLPAAEAR